VPAPAPERRGPAVASMEGAAPAQDALAVSSLSFSPQ
jgi:hypothetical protein